MNLASGRDLDDKACGAAGRSKVRSFVSRPSQPLERRARIVKLTGHINSSRHAIRRYMSRRIAARTAPPVPATGGFPYNRRSVAEIDPFKPRPNRPEKPEEYGYDERTS